MFTGSVILYSGITLVTWGLETALLKRYSQISNGPKLIFYRNSITSAIAFISILLFRQQIHFNFIYIIFGIILATFGYIGLLSYLKAFSLGKSGIVSPISSIRLVVAVLVATSFLEDSINIMQILTILLVLTGVILATINFRDFRTSVLLQPNTGIKYALLTALIWGIVHPLYSIPAKILGATLFSFILESSVVVIGGIQTKLAHNKIVDGGLRNNLPIILIVGILGGIGSVFLNMAYATGKISTASTVISAIPLIVVLYGVFVYKEKLTVKEQLSVFLIILGLILLSYFS